MTVFAFDCVKQRDKVALAKNAFKKLKMLRHPLMPKYIDGAETDSQIIYATEPLIPLKRILSTSSSSSTEDQAMKALGLYKIAVRRIIRLYFYIRI